MNFKPTIFFTVLFLIGGGIIGYAQPTQYDIMQSISKAQVLDSAHLRITYSLLYISDSLKPEQIWEDRKILLIGDTIQHFYSDYQRHADSAATALWIKGKSAMHPKFSTNVKREGYDIYTYPVSETRMVLDYITYLSLYKYVEDIEKPQWILSEDTCTILSYTCQKAITHFRGREWTVWFTMEIPTDAGPWKLCGLPGIIVKASDSREHYFFECIGLENISKKKQPIIKYQGTAGDLIECTRKEYLKAQQRFYDNYVMSLLSMGWNVNLWDDSGKIIDIIETPNTKFSERNIRWGMSIAARDRNKQKYSYNPIELE